MDEPDFADDDLTSVLEEPDEMAEVTQLQRLMPGPSLVAGLTLNAKSEVQPESSSSSSPSPCKWSHIFCGSSNCSGALTSSRNAASKYSSGRFGLKVMESYLLWAHCFDNV